MGASHGDLLRPGGFRFDHAVRRLQKEERSMVEIRVVSPFHSPLHQCLAFNFLICKRPSKYLKTNSPTHMSHLYLSCHTSLCARRSRLRVKSRPELQLGGQSFAVKVAQRQHVKKESSFFSLFFVNWGRQNTQSLQAIGICLIP